MISHGTLRLLSKYCANIHIRDSEDSAPAEFPPEQPEADVGVDDGTAYGAEEVELEEGLKAELAKVEGEDEEMGGAEETAGPAVEGKDDDEESDAGSEDLEAESSGSEDEEEEVEEGEGEGDEDMEMGDGDEHAAQANANKEQQMPQQHGEVMVH